jgi:four helix bundle protein
MRNYRNYAVWVKSHELVLFIYHEIAPEFPASEKYGLTSQLKRAAYSVPFNIVEGSGRNSEKDFAHFLDISLGSVFELEYCNILGRDLNYIEEELFIKLNGRINDVKAMLIKLIKTIRE